MNLIRKKTKQQRYRNLSIDGEKYRWMVSKNNVSIRTPEGQGFIIDISDFGDVKSITPAHICNWVKKNIIEPNKVVIPHGNDEIFFENMVPAGDFYVVIHHRVYGHHLNWFETEHAVRMFQNKEIAHRYVKMRNKNLTPDEKMINQELENVGEGIRNEYFIQPISVF